MGPLNELSVSSSNNKTNKSKIIIVCVIVLIIGIIVGVLVQNGKLQKVKGQFVSFQKALSELSPEMSAAVIRAVSSKTSIPSTQELSVEQNTTDSKNYPDEKSLNIDQVTASNKCEPDTPAWIRVLDLNGGEIRAAGSSVDIKWSSCNISPNSLVYIRADEYTSAGVSTNQNTVLVTNTLNDGIQTVTLPTLSGTTMQKFYRIFIQQQPGTGLMDRSDDNFKIIKTAQELSTTKNLECKIQANLLPLEDLTSPTGYGSYPMMTLHFSMKNIGFANPCLLKALTIGRAGGIGTLSPSLGTGGSVSSVQNSTQKSLRRMFDGLWYGVGTFTGGIWNNSDQAFAYGLLLPYPLVIYPGESIEFLVHELVGTGNEVQTKLLRMNVQDAVTQQYLAPTPTGPNEWQIIQ